MKIAIILNGISGKKTNFRKRILPRLEQNFSVQVFETKSPNDAFQLASEAVAKKFDLIIAAGGDGTLHQVLNGMLNGNEAIDNLPILGLIPIGTGNDFARSIGLKSIQSLITSISKRQTRSVNVGKIHFTNSENDQLQTRFFINVADVGMGPEVVKRISRQRKFLGIPYSYFLAILKTFFHYDLITIKAVTPDWSWEGKARAIAIANGKYFGQGLCIAPEAKLNDNLFSTFICAKVSVFDFIRYSIPLKKGKKIFHTQVQYGTCKKMELTSTESCGIEADGEYLGVLPAKIEMVKGTIQLV
jgi:YegS/Rv2252/BmrU family lipid kinase